MTINIIVTDNINSKVFNTALRPHSSLQPHGVQTVQPISIETVNTEQMKFIYSVATLVFKYFMLLCKKQILHKFIDMSTILSSYTRYPLTVYQ